MQPREVYISGLNVSTLSPLKTVTARAMNGEESVEQVAINMTRLSDAALHNAAR